MCYVYVMVSDYYVLYFFAGGKEEERHPPQFSNMVATKNQEHAGGSEGEKV